MKLLPRSEGKLFWSKGLWPEGYFLRCAYGVGVWLCSQDRDREARGEGFKFPECSHGQKFSRLLISAALAFKKITLKNI